jgi:hypothetical protein
VLAGVDPLAPAVELVLEVERVGNAPPGLEVAVNEAVGALERPLGLAVAGVEDDPAHRELTAEGEQRLGRPPAGRNRPLAVPDDLARQRAELGKAAAHPPGDVGELLREHRRAGEGARVGKLGGDDEAAARLAVADRDLSLRLAEVELAKLAGAVDRSLVGARRRQKPRPDLAQQVIEDRL